jgi:hypothetical protein
MKKISKQVARGKTVGNILASLRIEGLEPSPAVIRDLRACMAGEITTDKTLAKVMRLHVPLRRV